MLTRRSNPNSVISNFWSMKIVMQVSKQEQKNLIAHLFSSRYWLRTGLILLQSVTTEKLSLHVAMNQQLLNTSEKWDCQDYEARNTVKFFEKIIRLQAYMFFCGFDWRNEACSYGKHEYQQEDDASLKAFHRNFGPSRFCSKGQFNYFPPEKYAFNRRLWKWVFGGKKPSL